MSVDTSPNLFLLRDALKGAIKELDKADASPSNALAFLEGLDAADLQKHEQLVMALQVIAGELRSGSVEEAQTLLAETLDTATGLLPRFRIVLIDNTEHWTDEALRAKAGKIWDAYLYDENRATHLAELTPSYELTYLYCTAENQLPEDMEEVLLLNGSGDSPVIYMHCAQVDAISWDRKVACGEPSDPGADCYESLLEGEREYYCANVSIQTPRTPLLRDLVGVVIELVQASDLQRAEQIFVKDVLTYDAHPSIKSALQDIHSKQPLTEGSIAALKQLRDSLGHSVMSTKIVDAVHEGTGRGPGQDMQQVAASPAPVPDVNARGPSF